MTEGLADEIRGRAEERRAAGEYPPGLEHHLDRHFREVAEGGRGHLVHMARERAQELRRLAELKMADVAPDSRLPGGSVIHRVVSRSAHRQLEPVLEELRRFTDVVASALEAQQDAITEMQARLDALGEPADGAGGSGGETAS